MTLQVITFGCRLNTYESELIKKAASEAGLKDTVIFNSCAVTSEAERQLKQAIRKAKKNNPLAKIVVTGCAAQINPSRYASMEEVDKVLGNEEKITSKAYNFFSIDSEKILVNDIMSIKETALQLIDGVEGYSRAFVQVQNGCNHRCTYCSIPFGRGNSRSVPIGEIVTQCQKLVDNGYNEVVLTGVDITDYGLDLPGTPKLGQMVKRLLTNVRNLPRLRLSSIDVAEIDQDLFDLIANEPRLMPHLHLSLQSGNNLILKRMKRRHSREQVLEFCQKVRSLRSDVVIGADIITGFPTETDAMFKESYKLVEEAEITYLHIFPYSERENTPATRMPQVAKHIRKERAKILRELGERMLQKHFAKQIGKTLQVIIEQEGVARSEDFSLVQINSFGGISEVGSIAEVKITGFSDKYLLAKVASPRKNN